MGKASKLEHIVAKVEKKHEVEAKCLVDRRQVIHLLGELKEKQEEDKKELQAYKIEQGWIADGENKGVRLRKKIKVNDGTEQWFITKKTNGNGNKYSNEQEIEVFKEDLDNLQFFAEQWKEIEESGTIIRKTRYEFFYSLPKKDKKWLIELDLFDQSNLTLLEIEFKDEDEKSALAARERFGYKKLFKHLGIDFVRIPFEDKSFKNRSMSVAEGFLDGEFENAPEYLALKKKVKIREEETRKAEEKAQKRKKKEEEKREKQIRKAAKKAAKEKIKK
jgi:hypothetical protein